METEATALVRARELQEEVRWLRQAAPEFFSGAEFEIEPLPAEDGEESLLALRVYGSFPAAEFRERAHRLCTAMIEAGQRSLYEAVSIFQRSVPPGGR